MELLKNKKITITNVSFDIHANIKDVFTDINTGNKSYTFYEDPIDENNLQILFLFETPFHEAFGHWVFECAVFLPFVQNFTNYTNFSILVNKNSERKYKKSFFKLFNINDKNIQYIDNADINTTNISYKNIPKNNIAIVCRNFILNQVPNSLNNDLIETYKFLIDNFRKIILSDIDCEKKIENLVLPRSNLENYLPNDRQINYNSLYTLLKNKEYIMYDTQKTDNFIEQVLLIQKSKNIYIYWGSTYLVNGFFSKNSNIYMAMNNNNYNSYDIIQPLFKVLKNRIEENNAIFLV